MARTQNQLARINQSIKLLRKLPRQFLIPLALIAAVVIVVAVLLNRPATTSGPPGSFLFCWWNVENFYDDDDDPKSHDDMENWFAHNPDKFRLKVDRLADALLKMNDGRGPDIMALCEVENENCLNHLKAALNARLDPGAKYEHVLFKIDNTGRRFAPGIITRLPVDADRTFRFAKNPNTRTLEGHVKVNGHELIVLAAHWTSRVDSGGKSAGEEHANADRRMSYARDCYGRLKAIQLENGTADVLLCGDFNDEFNDPSIRNGLFATNNLDETRNAIAEPRPLALLASWPSNGDPPGTIYGRSRWSIFDHLLASRGLLNDAGWTCDPNTAAIFAPIELRRPGKSSKGEPFRFGDPKDHERGYSDHFPVTVRLKVAN